MEPRWAVGEGGVDSLEVFEPEPQPTSVFIAAATLAVRDKPK